MYLVLAVAAPAAAQGGAPGVEELAAPASTRSADLRTLRGGTPERGFDELVGGFVDESLFGGDYDGGSATVLATDVGLRLGIGRDARVRAGWGFAWSRQHVVGSFTTATMSMPYDAMVERVEARNTDLALEWAPWIGTNARFLLGVGTAIPTSALAVFSHGTSGTPVNVDEAAVLDASAQTHAIWLAMQGGWAPWRYQADRLSCFAPLGLYADLGAVELGVEGALAVSFPVLGGVGGPEAATMLALEVSGAIVPELTAGARASVSAFGLGGRGGAAQPALEPFVRLDVGVVSLSLRGVVNLGGEPGSSGVSPPPYGVGSANGVWAVHLGIAVAAEPEDHTD